MAYLAEFLGTMILVFLGNSVNANMNLEKTKGHGAGWLVTTLGWAMAVMVPVMMFQRMSGAHFNPAVTIGFAIARDIPWTSVPGYIGSQMAGAMLGGLLVWLQYRPHFNITDDQDAKLACFCTSPAIRSNFDNLVSEFLGTLMLVFAIIGGIAFAPDSIGPIGVGGIILAIGIGIGGVTGYAINPARDLGPRLAYCIAPIKNKRDPDWGYAWIPVIAPLMGGALGGVLGLLVFGY